MLDNLKYFLKHRKKKVLYQGDGFQVEKGFFHNRGKAILKRNGKTITWTFFATHENKIERTVKFLLFSEKKKWK